MWKTIIVVVVAALAYRHQCRPPALPVHVGGTADKRFKAVQDLFRCEQRTQSRSILFRENFAAGLESEGAAVAVYHEGNLVVDLWGGYAESDAVRLWERDTMTVIFSTSKVNTCRRSR